jgi:hypothetical protein
MNSSLRERKQSVVGLWGQPHPTLSSLSPLSVPLSLSSLSPTTPLHQPRSHSPEDSSIRTHHLLSLSLSHTHNTHSHTHYLAAPCLSGLSSSAFLVSLVFFERRQELCLILSDRRTQPLVLPAVSVFVLSYQQASAASKCSCTSETRKMNKTSKVSTCRWKLATRLPIVLLLLASSARFITAPLTCQ